MLNRRILRIKIMQALYAYFQAEDGEMAQAEKALFLSIDRLYDLYLYFLSFPVELKNIANRRIDDAKKKALPSKEDLNPSLKFVENLLINQLGNDGILKLKIEQKKLSWSAYNEDIRLFFTRKVKTSRVYEAYMADENKNFEEDLKFLIHLYRDVLPEAESILNALSEKSVYWDENDIDYALSNVIKTFKLCEKDKKIPLLPLYKNEAQDIDFVKTLFRKTIRSAEEFSTYIIEKAENWDEDRIATIDILLMKMALTELTLMPSIPTKVTLNEYIELSKWYSSPKSKVFINGILDRLVEEFKSNGKIKKTGRGLIED